MSGSAHPPHPPQSRKSRGGGAQPARPRENDGAAGLPARRAALAWAEAALGRRGGMDDADSASFADLDSRDRGFARALALALLRWKGPADRVLAERMRRPPPEAVMRLLRLGYVQMAALNAPPHAAVSTTLALAQADTATRGFVNLINAVLRGIDRQPAALTPDQFLPDWLLARWRAAYGDPAALGMAAAVAMEPETDLTPRSMRSLADLADRLEGALVFGATVRTGRRGDVAGWPGYDTGDWWVQDAAAAVPARVAAPAVGETMLDLCAAPGGKTLQLAAAGATVTALDRSEGRLRRLSDNLARTGLSAEIVAADALAWGDDRRFDGVLLDAPCSATGAYRRHPDVLWTARPSDIATLAATQARMLDAAAARVRPGGRLIYCVCSLEPEEGEGQVAPFLLRRPEMCLEPVDAAALGLPAAAITPTGTLRLLPTMGLDGFFIAKFRRLD